MKEQDALDMMQSDYKLWSEASSEELGGGVVVKSITLPWGIVEYSVRMEGMHNAEGRRTAVTTFGDIIRDLINERIDDTAITSRAQVAAASAEQANRGHGDGERRIIGVYDKAVPEKDTQDSTEARQGTVEGTSRFGDDLVAERAKVNGRIGDLTDDLARLCRQLRGIDAAIKAMKEDD